MKRHIIVTWTCFAISCIFAIAGVVLLLLMGDIIHDEIAGQIPLSPGSTSYENWLNPPVPVYMQFWFFNVTNGEEVQNVNGTKPNLQQCGPYTYQEFRTKSDIVFHDNGTVSYRQTRSYTFVEEMSSGSEDDAIINVNLILVTVSQMLGDKSSFINSLVEKYFEIYDGKDLFVKHTVKEWLWGYDDKGIDMIEQIMKKLNISLPIPARIGLYYGKNATDDGIYNIYTGTKGLSNYTVIDLWNGKPKLSFWTSDSANSINGTDGTTFPPFLNKSQKLYIFSSDICRSIYVVYQKKVTIRGIDLYRFAADPSLFENATLNPANAGFCSGGHCLDSGVLNTSICNEGQPVIMSQPHFFEAAPQYLNAVIGMHPSAALSQTYLDVDPITGVVLNAAKKLQVNIAVRPVAGFSQLRNVDLFLPIVWVNESAQVDEKSADEFKQQVTDLIQIATILKYVIFAFGTAFLLVMIVVVIVVMRRNVTKEIVDDRETIVNSEVTPDSDQA